MAPLLQCFGTSWPEKGRRALNFHLNPCNGASGPTWNFPVPHGQRLAWWTLWIVQIFNSKAVTYNPTIRWKSRTYTYGNNDQIRMDFGWSVRKRVRCSYLCLRVFLSRSCSSSFRHAADTMPLSGLQATAPVLAELHRLTLLHDASGLVWCQRVSPQTSWQFRSPWNDAQQWTGS